MSDPEGPLRISYNHMPHTLLSNPLPFFGIAYLVVAVVCVSRLKRAHPVWNIATITVASASYASVLLGLLLPVPIGMITTATTMAIYLTLVIKGARFKDIGHFSNFTKGLLLAGNSLMILIALYLSVILFLDPPKRLTTIAVTPGKPVPCIGNAPDVCISVPSIDLYPAGSEGSTNPELVKLEDGRWRTIGGTVSSINGKRLELATSSGRIFTVNFPVEIESWWNQNIGPSHKYTFGVGDTITVSYVEPRNQHSTTINADQIGSSSITLDPSWRPSEGTHRYGDKKEKTND